MVRKARFSWDDDGPLELPHDRGTFDDPDDLLDPLLPDSGRRPAPAAKAPKKRRRQPNAPAPRPDVRRHLAGADWLTLPPAGT